MLNRLPFDDLHGFCGWLQAAGAEVLPTANRWEIIRIRIGQDILTVFKGEKGRQVWPLRLEELRRAYLLGDAAPDLAQPTTALKQETVVLFADASFDHQTHAAGWGGWIKREAKRGATVSGPIRIEVHQSVDAELHALVNVMAAAKNRGLLFPDDVVLLQGDCLEALGLILGTVPNAEDQPAIEGHPTSAIFDPTPDQQTPLGWMAKVTRKLGLKILTRHVKGHQGGGWAEAINQRCDRLARRAMRLRKQEIEGNSDA